ncbi:hypothetical protein PR048_009175 [Dryococelus australis]|uniref:Major facilitator superfamily (MFS) profile domain-containing protein n=1 Tax=Dryococelus australis TaxID=614101 RepID=A0ABQ9I025_9NEOP|nr:hypothetical protein PR048_009175 [Dryococelus australis]
MTQREVRESKTTVGNDAIQDGCSKGRNPKWWRSEPEPPPDFWRRRNEIIPLLAQRDAALGPRWQFWRRRRDVLALLAFFGLFNIAGLRVNLSVAIVAMTSWRNLTTHNGTVMQVRDMDWDSKTQGVMHSAFFYGFMVSQVPGGWLAGRYGGCRLFGLAIGLASLLTLLTPLVARVDVRLLFVIRALEGLGAVSHSSCYLPPST